MGFLRGHRKHGVVSRLVAVVLVAGGLVVSASTAASASAIITLNHASGLNQAQVVTVTGTGLAANTYGYVLECNNTPGQPTVPVGPPFDEAISIGCSPPSLKHLVSTSATGSLSTTFAVHESRKLGPPCGQFTVFGGCVGVDSANKHPRADAQNFPCPPSPAQQTAGVTCSIVFLDAAHERAAAQITFSGAAPSTGKPPPTTPATTATTVPNTTPTTAPPATTKTTPPAVTAVTPTPVHTITTTVPAPVTQPVTHVAPAAAAASPAVVKVSSKSLAFTGLGMKGKLVALLGGLLVLLGLVLFFVDLRKMASWFLGL
jgi:hypothetical protein